MKRYGKMMVIMGLALAFGCTVGAQEDEDILRKLAEANQVPYNWTDHSSVALNKIFYKEDGDVDLSEYFFADEEKVAFENSDSLVDIMAGGRHFGFDSELNTPYIYVYLDPSGYDEEYEEFLEWFCCEEDDDETLQEVTESDGLLKITSSFGKERLMGSVEALEWSESWEQEGEGLTVIYMADPETYEVVSQESYARRSDGSLVKMMDLKFTYDSEYEVPEELLSLLNSEDSRKLTVIADPGTEKERISETEVGKGVYFRPVLPEGYEGYYVDPECTQPLESTGDGTEDILIYIAEGK